MIFKIFSSSNIKKVTDLTSFTVWDRRKWRVTAKKRQNRYWNTARSATFQVKFPKPSLNFFAKILRKLQVLLLQGCGTAGPEHLKWDFKNCLWNFSSLNIKKVTDLTSLTVWDCRKRRMTAKDGKNRWWNSARPATFEVRFPKPSLTFF